MVIELLVIRKRNRNLGSNAVPIAARADQLQGQPVPSIGGNVMEQAGRAIDVGHNAIDPTVFVEIGKGNTAILTGEKEIGACAGGYLLETSIAAITEHGIWQRGCGAEIAVECREMRIRSKDVFEPIVIEIIKADSPPGQRARRDREP